MKPNPKIANVPETMLRNGLLDCISCHEVHPSNPNFAYLRADVGKDGTSIQNLCAMCHSAKVDLAAAGIKDPNKIKIFSAMDQKKGAGFYSKSQVTVTNETKEYITPLGKLPANDLLPNYQNPPSWVYAPEINPDKKAAPKKAKKPVKKP